MDNTGATVTPSNNGPYKVTGNFKVVDVNGKEFEVKGDAYLCRCGGSSKKPFCDGTHNKIAFKAETRAD